MPTDLYDTLYSHDNLYTVMTMLKDIYAKKPQNMVATAAGVAQGATAPFNHIGSPTRGAPKAQSDASLEDRILQLTETLYCIDMNGKLPRKPFKPFITNLEEISHLDVMGVMDALPHLMEDLSHQINMENNKDPEDASDLEDHLESLTKAPTLNVPESLVDLLTRIEFTAFDVKSLVTCKRLSRTQQTSTKGHCRT